MTDLTPRYSALEDLEKARKAKGISRWEKFQVLSGVLDGKTAKDITFTAVNPDGSTSKHILGSSDGNLKFLLGYVNPGFHVAPYHYMVVDPNITPEEAQDMYETRGHPSLPRYWQELGIDPFEEGDTEEGSPHPSFVYEPEDAENDPITFSSNQGKFVASPEDGLLYGEDTERVYDWSLVRNTHFSSQMPPEIVEVMEAEAAKVTKAFPAYKGAVNRAEQFSGCEWDLPVYPLVKSLFPQPGSVLRMDENLYGVVSPSSVILVDREGTPTSVEVWDSTVSKIDLVPGVQKSCIVLNFAAQYLGLDLDSLQQFIHEEAE